VTLSSFRNSRASQRWSFTEQDSTVAELGLATPIELAGAWLLEDHEPATGGRALVNHAGAANGPPALAVSSLRTRDVRAATRCKAEATGTACGLVFRYHDAQCFDVAHVDRASQTIGLSAVVDGAEKPIAQISAEIADGSWQARDRSARGSHHRLLERRLGNLGT